MADHISPRSFPGFSELPEPINPPAASAIKAILREHFHIPDRLLQIAREEDCLGQPADADSATTERGTVSFEARVVRNLFTNDEAIVSGDLTAIACRNGITPQDLIDYLAGYERPSEVIRHFRGFEIIQQMRLLRECRDRDFAVNAVVQSSRKRRSDVKLWILGKDGCGVGEAVLAAIHRLKINGKGLFAFSCEPLDYFLMSLRFRRMPVDSRWRDLSDFACNLKDELKKTIQVVMNVDEYRIDVRSASEKRSVLNVTGSRQLDPSDVVGLEIWLRQESQKGIDDLIVV